MDKSGKIYTINVDNLPSGRGHGEPINIMVDIANGLSIVDIIIYNYKTHSNTKVILASSDGRGFITKMQNLVAQTKTGKQVLNVTHPVEAKLIYKIHESHDGLSVIGNNRKMLIYKISEVPEMNRGRGVILQKYTQGSLSDLVSFEICNGLSWKLGEKTRTEHNLITWLGKRGQIGKLPPVGFPKNNKYSN